MGKASRAPAKPTAAARDGSLSAQVLQAAEAARPYFRVAKAALESARARAEPYATPEDLLKLLCGAIATFFGARYMVTIAAIEAFRMVGYARTLKSFQLLHASYEKAAEASAKDDTVDADADGVPDAAALPLDALLARKLPIVLKAVEPDRLAEALAGVWAGAAAVVATLRVQFAQTLTLGATLGDVASDLVGEQLRAAAVRALPADWAKFAPLAVQYAARALGVLLALALARLAAAVHSAARGAQLLAEGALAVGARAGYVSAARAAEPQVRQGLQLGLAVLGVVCQLRSSFRVPFPLNLLLLPLTLFDAALAAAVGVGVA